MLSVTGQGWVNKTGPTKLALREGHDVLNTPFVGAKNQYNQLQVRTSEYTGTTNDPVLEVTYTLPPPTTTITYAYDSMGQRIKVTTPTTTTTYPSTWYNVDAMGKKVKHIMASSSMAATVETTGTTTTPHYVHTDQLTGSNVVTSSTGTQEELTDYFPFGAIRLDEKVSTFSEQRKFTGQEYDVDTGLSYMNARYYNGTIGRFISEDPFEIVGLQMVDQGSFITYLVNPQRWNTYSYALNNPLIVSDPSGLIPTKEEAEAMVAQIAVDGKEGENLSGGWQYINSLTNSKNLKMGVYSREKQDTTTEYALVNKGTTPSSLNDWTEDLLLQPFGFSKDLPDSVRYATQFVQQNKDNEITFVGYSKGGAESAANAVALNKNAILFNPAAVNLGAYGLNKKDYHAQMIAYIVQGEIVHASEGWISNPIGNVEYLPTQHSTSWLTRLAIGPFSALNDIYHSVQNHSMQSVVSALGVKR